MLRNLFFLLAVVVCTASYSYSQSGLGTLKGHVKDSKSKDDLYGAKVLLKQNGAIKNGANTDADGKFQLNSIAPGSYDVEFRLDGYGTIAMSGVVISSDKITFLDNVVLDINEVPVAGKPKSSDGVQEKEEVKVIAYKVPLINKDGGASGGTMTREDISKLPVRNAAQVAQTVGGVSTNEGTGEMSVRGSRSDDSYYYIDGIKVRGSSNLPKSAMEEVSVITGGQPANYGDATGGIISITTRGPSAKFFGSAEAVTSGFYVKGSDPNGYTGKVFGLDKYGYNLAEGMLSGPLLMQRDSLGNKRKDRSLLGFLVTLNYTNELDNRPLANGGGYRVKKDVRDQLLANPLAAQPDGRVPLPSANFLHKNDFEQVPWRMNASNSVLSASGKIDVRTGPTMNLTFGGSLNYSTGKAYSYANSLLNFTNFGDRTSLDWRVYGRLSQRFVNNQQGTSSKIKSAYYSVMVDYSNSQTQQFDAKHKFNAFDYGYVGKFTTTQKVTDWRQDLNSSTEFQASKPKDVRVEFDPSTTNAALAAITTQYFSIYKDNPIGYTENLSQVQAGNALRNGDQAATIYDIWYNIGTPYNYMGKSDNSQFRVTGSGSVNIGDHALTLGFEFEQRTDRGWSTGNLGPIGLWTIARQLVNGHNSELDLNSGDTTIVGNFKRVTYDYSNSGYAYKHNGVYGGDKAKLAFQNDPINNTPENQSFFDFNLRNKLGLPGGGANNSRIDFDRVDPSLLSLSMFSPDELLNNGNTYISYYGYDIAGNKLRGKTDIDKYFNEFDNNGNYKRFVGAFQPIYVSGYIMDKFAFSDLVFNVGVRVDVFDANQPVLKDPYLLNEAHTVGEISTIASGTTNNVWLKDYLKTNVVPSSMGSDYVVYVDDIKNPSAITGYRSGSQWYNSKGVAIDDSKSVEGSGGISPWLLDPENSKKISSKAFTTYKPQVNVMPRLAFSFPISDEASFFAHYDILTKRPTSAARFNPTDYQFISVGSPTINNPDLKPETTIDYELGFQQVLTPTSSLKISAFYREQRNQVQLIKIYNAYPNSYNSFGNRDFGTVKGLTIAYDLRRTGNLRMTANYTLQFAEGTGSDATSSAAVTSLGLNFRSIFPYDFDTRHQFNIVADYRYSDGKDYNGPTIAGIKLFENTGINLLTNIYSGSPYSSQVNITNAASLNGQYSGLTGTTNGSRQPWSYRLDIQLDKTINLAIKQKDGAKKMTFLNIYVRATNLLNQFNVINVYRATGNWNDDGYLAASQFQNAIQNQYDEQAFRDYYTMKVQNAFNISSPRTIRLGVKFDF
jgi:hypothetical protein